MKYLLNSEMAIIEQHQNYVKQTYSNRCKILSSNGIQVLSIPVLKIHNQKQPIGEVKINYEEDWQKQHWLAFQSAYGKSAFWLYYKDYFETLYLNKKPTHLVEFNIALLKIIIKLLKVDKQFTLTESYLTNYDDALDLRNYFDAKNRNEKELEEANYLKKYIQVFTEKFPFQSNLSVIDLLMNQGPMSKNYLLND